MLLTANIGVALIENSSGREAATVGLRAAAAAAYPAAIPPLSWWKGQGQSIISCFILRELKSSTRCYLGLFVTVIQHGTTLHFRRHCLCLLFGVYIYSADLWAKQAHEFSSSTSCCSSSHALAFRRTGICHTCDCYPVWFPVLHREKLESSWIDIWTSAATAARTVGVASATAVATTSPWVASTLGLTTTKEGESFVTLSCHATGGLRVCWAGSEEHCLGFKLIIGENDPFDIYFRPHVRQKQFTANIY